MNNDPKGYYAILGIPTTASNEDIKQAFRTKAKEVHPDKNQDRDTTKEFQFLSEANEVLSDPNLRAKYDSLAYQTTEKTTTPEPIKCATCQKITAQPRYVIFFEVKSFVFVTTRNATQGIFCSECADKAVLKPTLITWVLGWWGFPFGILYSLHAIWVNLFGGEKPKSINRDILRYQAWYFAQKGNLNIADFILGDALKFTEESKQVDEIKEFRKTLKMANGNNDFKKLKNKWLFFSRSFMIQLIIILTVLIAITASIIYSSYQERVEAKKYEEAKLAYEKLHPILSLPDSGALLVVPKKEKIMAPFRVSTSGQGHHLVKLQDVSSGKTILEMFIRAGDTIDTTVPLGTYTLKYASGNQWYGKQDLFGEETIRAVANETFTFKIDGNSIVGNTVELILQRNGNLQTTNISKDQF